MVLEKIETILNDKNKIEFKLYGVKYTIEKTEDSFSIYHTSNDLRQTKYLSLNELFKEYTVYNEALEDNQKYVQLLKNEKE